MNYTDRHFVYSCPECNATLKIPEESRGFWVKCGACKHEFKAPENPIPKFLYFGSFKTKRIKLLPLPKKQIMYTINANCYGYCDHNWNEQWGTPTTCGHKTAKEIQPYSIRSFLLQLTQDDVLPCKYFVETEGVDDFGNVYWVDKCLGERITDCVYGCEKCCSVATGWMHGESECSGWKSITEFCDSNVEKTFLREYIRQNHDKESPMLIPQVWLGLKEKRRVDFVLIIPKTAHNCEKLAIEINPPKYHSNLEKELAREKEITSEGYKLLKYSKNEIKDRLNAVRNLREYIERVKNLKG